jgi:hypothetical protein
MNLPTLRSTDRTQMTERRHSDPPALWITVILSSVVFHLFAVGMLRLLLMGRLYGLQSGTTLVPVDVVSIDPNVTLSTQPTQTPGSVAITKPTPISTPTKRTSNRLPERQPSSISTSSSTRANSREVLAKQNLSQRGEVQPSPRQFPSPNPSVKPSPNPSASPSPKPSPNPSASPSPNPSPNPSASPSPNPSPNPSASPSPNPSPNPSPIPPPNPSPIPPPNPQPGGGFHNAAIGGLSLTVPDRDIPTQYATLPEGSITKFPTDSLTALGIDPNQVLVLKVQVLIEATGKPTVLPNTAELLPGNISKDKAEQLAKQIIEKWTFNPTYMGSGPVTQAYNIELNITQLLN